MRDTILKLYTEYKGIIPLKKGDSFKALNILNALNNTITCNGFKVFYEKTESAVFDDLDDLIKITKVKPNFKAIDAKLADSRFRSKSNYIDPCIYVLIKETGGIIELKDIVK